MTTLQLKVDLPDPLAAEAQAAGLLDPAQLERMLREALRVKRVEKLALIRDVLVANPLPPMTPEEIQAEIAAYRAEVHRATGRTHGIPGHSHCNSGDDGCSATELMLLTTL